MVASVSKLKFKQQKVEELVRLDLGTGKGKSKPEGYVGVDIIAGEGVDVVTDLRKPWPWKDNSVDEAMAHNVLQFLNAQERTYFVNELCRVLKSGGKASVVVPHWLASRAYMDPTIQWPPVAEAWFVFLTKAARDEQNYKNSCGLTCDFDFTLGYGLHPNIVSRNIEYQQQAVTFWKEAAQDIIVTLIKR